MSSLTATPTAFTPPPQNIQAFLKFMARQSGPVASVPTSYVRPLNTCYVNRWVRDTADTPPQIELTETGRNAARVLADQAKAVA